MGTTSHNIDEVVEIIVSSSLHLLQIKIRFVDVFGDL